MASIPSKNSVGYPKGITGKQARAKRRRESRKEMIEWHNRVCNRAMIFSVSDDYRRTSMTDLFRCDSCRRLFPRNMVCGHHLQTRGSRPDLKYDPDNGMCVCAHCHHFLHHYVQATDQSPLPPLPAPVEE